MEARGARRTTYLNRVYHGLRLRPLGLILMMIALLVPTPGLGQGPPAAPGGLRFFDCPEVRFFEPCPGPGEGQPPAGPRTQAPLPEAQAQARPAPKEKEPDRWTELVPTPQGLQPYTPPPPLVTLLEEPTEANARAFLAWQRERLKRIQEVQRLLSRLGREDASALPATPTRILAFLSPRCPFSRQQLPVLAALAREGVAITGIAPEGTPAELEAFRRGLPFPLRPDQGEAAREGITGYPTLVFLDETGREVRRQIGLTSEDVIRQLLQGRAVEGGSGGFTPAGRSGAP